MINSTSSQSTLAAMHALFAALGEPTRSPLSESEESLPDMRYHNGMHPIFELAETFGPGDAGYTRNHPQRGGHLSLPCFHEDGGVVVIETTFHKGDTTVDRLDYPRKPVEVHAALYALLEKLEDRD